MNLTEKSIVVSLRTSADRLASFLPAWEAEGVKPLIFDGLTWPHHVPRPHSYARGAVGCSLSHLAAIRIAKMLGWDTLLLLEDDARPEADFIARLDAAVAELPSDWRICFVGNAGGDALAPSLPTVVPARQADTRGSIALLFNISAINDILDTLDGMGNPTTSLYKTAPGAYALRDPLAWHVGGVSTITGETLLDLRTFPLVELAPFTVADIPKTPSAKATQKTLADFFSNMPPSPTFDELFTRPDNRVGLFRFFYDETGNRVIPIVGKAGSTTLAHRFGNASRRSLTADEWTAFYQEKQPEIVIIMRDPFARLFSIVNFESHLTGASSFNQGFRALIGPLRADKDVFIKTLLYWIYRNDRSADIYDMHIVSQTKAFASFVKGLPFTVHLIDDLDIETHANRARGHRFIPTDLEPYRDVIIALFKTDYDFLLEHYNYTGPKHAVSLTEPKG